MGATAARERTPPPRGRRGGGERRERSSFFTIFPRQGGSRVRGASPLRDGRSPGGGVKDRPSGSRGRPSRYDSAVPPRRVRRRTGKLGSASGRERVCQYV